MNIYILYAVINARQLFIINYLMNYEMRRRRWCLIYMGAMKESHFIYQEYDLAEFLIVCILFTSHHTQGVKH